MIGSDPYLATVTIFAGNFAPRAWMFCQGQLLSIAENTALYSLIGTTYGGDGQVTFGLPDLRGRTAIHMGQGPGLSNYTLGEVSGTESTTMVSSQLPGHNHIAISLTGSPTAVTGTGNLSDPTNAVPANGGENIYSTSADGSGMGHSTGVSQSALAGGSQPFSLLSPIIAMNYVIAVEGIYPSRN
ncbi:tail fiber protein [soil metagenome]